MLTHGPGEEDTLGYLHPTLQFFTTIFVGLCFAVIALGGGRHEVVTYLEHPEHIVPFLKLALAAGVIYNPALFSIKVKRFEAHQFCCKPST